MSKQRSLAPYRWQCMPLTISPRGSRLGTRSFACGPDRERRRALVSRDIRWVLVALILAVGGAPTSVWPALWRLLGGG
jgi:hypothetical protein